MTEHAENFIPWSMIEPLVREGMTGAELKARLCALTRLDSTLYCFVTKLGVGHLPYAEAIRAGLYIERMDTPTFGTYFHAGDELAL